MVAEIGARLRDSLLGVAVIAGTVVASSFHAIPADTAGQVLLVMAGVAGGQALGVGSRGSR